MKASISVSGDLHAAGVVRLKILGYESFSAYIAGLIRADIITGPPHDLPQRIARMSGRHRGKIDDALISQARIPVDEIDDDNPDEIIAVAQAYRSRLKSGAPPSTGRAHA